jgi:ABC-type nickel/cobalt efflux system permease component RcnA
MILLGLILVILAAALIAAALVNGGAPAVTDFSAFEIHTTVAGVFAEGAATVLAIAIGAWLLRAGLARRRRRRREVKELRKQVDVREQQAAELRERQSEALKEHGGEDPDAAFDSTPRE